MSKKIFSILLSVMMLISLMPTMAFAIQTDIVDVEYDVSKDYSVAVVTYKDGQKLPVIPQKRFVTTSSEAIQYRAPVGSISVKIPGALEFDTFYFDMSGASIVYLDGDGYEDFKTIDADEYCSMVTQKSGKVSFKKGYDVWDVLSNGIPNTSSDAESHYIKFVRPQSQLVLGSDDEAIAKMYSAESYFDVNAVLPTYEKYQDDDVLDVFVSFMPTKARINDIGGVQNEEDHRLASEVFLNSSLIRHSYQFGITRPDEIKELGVSLDSIKTPQTLQLYREEISSNGELSRIKKFQKYAYDNDFNFNFVVGFYNGKEQNFNVKTKNVDVKYSTDGKTWGDTAPTFTDATVGLGTLVDLVEELGEATGDAFNAKLVKYLVNNSFQMKVKTGTDTSVITYVVPIILPKELFVEFKSHEFNFLPGTTPELTDILTTNLLTGYEDAIPVILDLVNNGIDGNTTDEYVDLVEEALNIIDTDRTNICDKDKDMADRFLDEFFELEEMPTFGSYYPIDFKNNVKFDLGGMLERMEKDDEFAQFMKNYDILGQLMMMQSGSIAWTISNEKFFEDLFNEKLISFLSTTGDMRLFNNRLLLLLQNMVDSKLNYNSTITYSTENNVIHANNAAKTYHVKKAKTLKKSKSFYYKASADYGMVTYKKLSSNKKVSINQYTGKVTVKKGLKRGKKYNIKVLVKAPGKSVTKTITIKIVK